MTAPLALERIFTELISIPSPSRNESAVADWVENFCQNLGFTVERDNSAATHGGNCDNLMVRLPATSENKPNLLMAAHLDTVEKGDRPVGYEKRGEEIHTRGETILGADDKCGVACLLELIQQLAATPETPHGEVGFVFTVCEEIELLGSKAMPDSWLAGFDAGIVLDHSGPDEIVIASPAKDAMRITVSGIEGHASSPERRINAAHLLCTAMSRLPSGRLDGESTANLGIVNSGRAINVIPGTAYAEYELRSHDEARLDLHSQRTRRIIEDTTAAASIWPEGTDNPRHASVEVAHERCYHAYALCEESPPRQLLSRAITNRGGTPHTVRGQGGSDANVFNRRGLPACVYGCGMHGAHSHRERANLDEMQSCVDTLAELVRGDG